MKVWEDFINNNAISDEDILRHYYIYYHQWDSPQKELIKKYNPKSIITVLVKCGIFNEDYIEEVVTKHAKSCIKQNKSLTDSVLTEISQDIAKQALTPEFDTSIPMLASNNKYTGYSIFKNDTLVKFDERDLVDGKYEIPQGITTIDDYAFMKCYKLKQLTIPSSVNKIGFCAFAMCKNLQNIIIPNSVTDIDAAAFFACINLIELKLSNKLTNIPTLLCFNCKKLTKVILPSSLTHIESDAFLLCNELNDINIPKKLQKDWNNNKFKSSNTASKKIIENILKIN